MNLADVEALEELAAQVEANEPIVTARRPASELTDRRGETVRNVELEQMAAGSLLDPELSIVSTRTVSGAAGNEFTDEIDR